MTLHGTGGPGHVARCAGVDTACHAGDNRGAMAPTRSDADRWILYTAPGSCGLAAHIALHEAHADFSVVLLDLAAGQQKGADYLAINPKGRVPALATPQGVLTETPAILAFVARTFARAALAPRDDAFAWARLLEFNSYLASTVHVAHAHKRRGARWADDPAAIEAMRRKVPQTMGDCATRLEAGLSGPWVLGEHYSVADPYLFTLVGWLEGDGVALAPFARLRAHFARVAARPATRRALAESGA